MHQERLRFGLDFAVGLPVVPADCSEAAGLPGPNKPGLKLGLNKSGAPVEKAFGVPPVKPTPPGYWPEVSVSGRPRMVPGFGIGWENSDLRKGLGTPFTMDWPLALVLPPKPAGPPLFGNPGAAALVFVPLPEVTPGKSTARSSRVGRPSSERRLSASESLSGLLSLLLGLYLPL